MPAVIITPVALRGLEKCRLFLASKDIKAGRRAAETIKRQFALLETHPEIGRPVNDIPLMRELVVPFGETGFIALYRYGPAQSDMVYILAFRHQKEAGY